MNTSTFDYQHVKSELLRIFGAASDTTWLWDKEHIETLINVGEYSLALDELAALYLRNGGPDSPNMLPVFEDLATRMEMVSGDEFESVARLRETHGHH